MSSTDFRMIFERTNRFLSDKSNNLLTKNVLYLIERIDNLKIDLANPGQKGLAKRPGWSRTGGGNVQEVFCRLAT